MSLECDWLENVVWWDARVLAEAVLAVPPAEKDVACK